jgi:hypothetical protein
MDKKEFYTPVLIVGLSLAFVLVSLMVWFSKGKSARWVARKMKIGGLLLTLSASACNPSSSFVTCYDMPAPPNSIWMNGISENGLEIMLDTSNLVTGIINNRQGETFSFAIQSSDDQVVQSDSLIPLDGKFDNSTENFKIEIDTNITAGNYLLNLYDVELDQQSTVYPRLQFILLIKNE